MKKLITAFFLFAGAAQADTLRIDGECDVHFSPNGGAEARIVQYINTAQQSVKVLAYSFTSARIGAALINAHTKGVSVEVVADRSQPTAQGSQVFALRDAGIPVYIDSKHAIAHNKTIVIDGKFIELGSFNFTTSAEKSNGENALICPSVSGAAVYTADFEKHKSHSVKF